MKYEIRFQYFNLERCKMLNDIKNRFKFGLKGLNQVKVEIIL